MLLNWLHILAQIIFLKHLLLGNLFYLINLWCCTSSSPWCKQLNSLHRSSGAVPDQCQLLKETERKRCRTCGLWSTLSSSTKVICLTVGICFNSFFELSQNVQYFGRWSPQHFGLCHSDEGEQLWGSRMHQQLQYWSWLLEALCNFCRDSGKKTEEGREDRQTFSFSRLPGTQDQRKCCHSHHCSHEKGP